MDMLEGGFGGQLNTWPFWLRSWFQLVFAIVHLTVVCLFHHAQCVHRSSSVAYHYDEIEFKITLGSCLRTIMQVQGGDLSSLLTLNQPGAP